MHFLDELNPKQREAALHTDGPILIVAGAGTGKTKTLTHRIANLIHNGVAPQHILAITFTNKAAREMKERLEHLLARNPAEGMPFASTFHAFGVHVLRNHGTILGLKKSFTILDTSDTTTLLKEAMRNLSIDPKVWDPKQIKNRISGAKGDGLTPLEYSDRAASEKDRITGEAWIRYEELKNQSNALDFDDLLIKPLELLRKHPDVLAHYHDAFRYIHVDEYQDTNTAQYELVRLLSQTRQNICAVGDTDQTIYSWRGADFRNMLRFEKDYPDATIVTLETNYRSTKTILRAADDVIIKNKERIPKTLVTDNEVGYSITRYTAMSGGEESAWVAMESARLIKDGAAPSDIAVLYRTNFQSRALEEAFLYHDVPYHILGTKFFERAEVKDTLAYLRAAYNPDSRPDIARIINTPKRGIGKVTLAKVFAGDLDKLTPAIRTKYESFMKLLASIRIFAEKNSVSETIKFIIKESGMETLYQNGDSEDAERLENLKELVTYATRYDLFGEEGLAQFLENTSLLSDQDSLGEGPKDAVRLMTIHASKGLEFKVVFIVGLEQGLFPSERDDNPKSAQEEERRLMYVAITRAKEKLYLTHSFIRRIFGEERMQTPSEYFNDLSPELVVDEGNSPQGRGGSDDLPTVYLDF